MIGVVGLLLVPERLSSRGCPLGGRSLLGGCGGRGRRTGRRPGCIQLCPTAATALVSLQCGGRGRGPGGVCKGQAGAGRQVRSVNKCAALYSPTASVCCVCNGALQCPQGQAGPGRQGRVGCTGVGACWGGWTGWAPRGQGPALLLSHRLKSRTFPAHPCSRLSPTVQLLLSLSGGAPRSCVAPRAHCKHALASPLSSTHLHLFCLSPCAGFASL